MNEAKTEFLTLSDLFEIVIKGKKIIILSVVMASIAAIVFLMFTTHRYVAEINIGPNENTLTKYSSDPGLGMLGSASSLFGEEQGGDFNKLIHLLTSDLVAAEMLTDPRFPEIFYPEIWDEEKEDWLPPSGILPAIKSFIMQAFGRPGWTPPG